VDVIESGERLRLACEKARGAGSNVGFVPTMGALHGGHARLLGQARGECGFVAMSIFVNPLQFDSAQDLTAYPRPIERDLAAAESLGVNVAFVPEEDEVYPEGRPDVSIDPGPLGERLEGASRPGHFRGVLTVVAKLFNLVGPSRAYFGEKDAQQLALVRRMVSSLDVPVTVVACPTVRETDGLAISSRNVLLSPDQRRASPVLFEALSDAATRARQGERRADVLRAEIARLIGGEPAARLDYVAIVDDTTWEVVEAIEGPARALVAAFFGDVRLIDNLPLPADGGRTTMQNTPETRQEG
jgi:pantoate--beta-alanine ligase